MEKWEYRVQTIRMGGGTSKEKKRVEQRQKLERELTAFGADGWEMVNFNPVDKQGGYLLVFKRRTT